MSYINMDKIDKLYMKSR